jgi:hypothetical protein
MVSLLVELEKVDERMEGYYEPRRLWYEVKVIRPFDEGKNI